MSTKI